jgi:hypothetical protein
MAAPDNKTGPKPVFINNIVTPKGRISFPHIAEPDSKGKFADNKYKVTLLMPKDTTDFAALRAVALKCAQDAFGPSIKTLKDFQAPFRNGDEKDLDGYQGQLYITCKSKNRPHVVDRAKNALDPKEIYGGCFARLVVSACSYQSTETVRQADGSTKKQVVKGVTFLLDAVQKMGDGDSFGGKGNAANAFPDDEEASAAPGFEDGDGPTGNGAHEGDESDMFR